MRTALRTLPKDIPGRLCTCCEDDLARFQENDTGFLTGCLSLRFLFSRVGPKSCTANIVELNSPPTCDI